MSTNQPSALINIKVVIEMTTFSRTKIYKLMNDGEFPRLIKIGCGSYWKRKEIEDWLDNLTPVSDSQMHQLSERYAQNAQRKAL